MSGAEIRRCVALVIALALPAMPAAAPLPPVDHVAFAPAPGAVLPLQASFNDEFGRPIRLADLLRERPAIVVPAYYGCSNLCTIVLQATKAALASAGLRAGRDLNVIAISFAPLETPALALAKKREVLGTQTREERDGWHFLTGDEQAITSVTNALGYRYTYVAGEHQYAHAAGIAMVAPDGRIARILYGVAFAVADLHSAFAAARSTSEHETAGTASAAEPSAAAGASNWLLCFHYDPRTGRYSFAAMSAVRAAGLVALFALAGYAAVAWRRERRDTGAHDRESR